MEQTHVPVLFQECIDNLNIRPDGIYVDGTLGRCGHSREIVRHLTTGRLIGIDRDAAAISHAETVFAECRDRVTLVRGNFSELRTILEDLGVSKVDGMLFDLGVSSPQLDEAARGFSYMQDAPLDMRMDQDASLRAYDVINTWDERELKRILFEYGEEKYAPRIAGAIVKYREKKPVETTFELVDIIRGAMPAAALREKQHPAKRSFQAVRIAVNDELNSVSRMLGDAAEMLNPGGRIAVISFHSLEDRIVKNAFQSREKGCTCPPGFPVCVCGFKQTLKVLTRKPILPSAAELEINPRSRSAKLRVAERVGE